MEFASPIRKAILRELVKDETLLKELQQGMDKAASKALIEEVNKVKLLEAPKDGAPRSSIESGKAIPLTEKAPSTTDLESQLRAMGDKERADFLNSLTEKQKQLLLVGRGENPIPL